MGFSNKGAKALELIQKGKELKDKVDAKVEISEVDYASMFVSELLYTGITSPLKAVYELLSNLSTTVEKKKVLVFVVSISVVMLIPLITLSIIWGANSGLVYLIATVAAVYLMYHATNNSTTKDLDDLLSNLLSCTNVDAEEREAKPEVTETQKQYLSNNAEVDEDMYL